MDTFGKIFIYGFLILGAIVFLVSIYNLTRTEPTEEQTEKGQVGMTYFLIFFGPIILGAILGFLGFLS